MRETGCSRGCCRGWRRWRCALPPQRGLRVAWGNEGQSMGWGQGPTWEIGCGCLFPRVLGVPRPSCFGAPPSGCASGLVPPELFQLGWWVSRGGGQVARQATCIVWVSGVSSWLEPGSQRTCWTSRRDLPGEGGGGRGHRSLPAPSWPKAVSLSTLTNSGKERDCFISTELPVSSRPTRGCLLQDPPLFLELSCVPSPASCLHPSGS